MCSSQRCIFLKSERVFCPIFLSESSTFAGAQVGMSEKRVLGEMHRDAVDKWEMTSSLQDVCSECCDPQTRLVRQVGAGRVFGTRSPRSSPKPPC